MAYYVLNEDVLLKCGMRGRRCNYIVGEPGPAGPQGEQGPAGPRGPRGMPGVSTTSICMSAYSNGGEIRLKPLGTLVKLPLRGIGGSFSSNSANTVFTVPENGLYLVSYQVNFNCDDCAVRSTVTRNGTSIDALDFLPDLPHKENICQSIVQLDAGDKLSLVLYAAASAVNLQNGAGAYLNIVRLA